MPIYIYIFLGLLSLIWGASFFFVKILLPFFDPWSISFLRCLFGTIALLLVVWVRREPFAWKKLPWIPLILIGLANSAIPWTLIAFSETMLSSGLTAVLNSLTPICTLLIGIAFFKVKTLLNQWIGIGLGFTGIAFMMHNELSGQPFSGAWGFILMLIVTLLYGWSAQMSKLHFQHISVYVVSLLTLLVGTIGSGLMAISTESLQWNQLAVPEVFWSIVWLGVLGSGLAYILFYLLVQKGTAEFATLVTYLVPPFAILWGYFLLDESLSSSLFIGLGMILLGVFISGRKKQILSGYSKKDQKSGEI